ncbi:MAG: hypothetical protein QXR73_02960 [Candidatus Micrarchaeaceae archaeon]
MTKRKIRIRHPGSLKTVGFSESESIAAQRRAIRRADRRYGRGETNRKLAALEAFNKRRPKTHKRIKRLIAGNRR